MAVDALVCIKTLFRPVYLSIYSRDSRVENLTCRDKHQQHATQHTHDVVPHHRYVALQDFPFGASYTRVLPHDIERALHVRT